MKNYSRILLFLLLIATSIGCSDQAVTKQNLSYSQLSTVLLANSDFQKSVASNFENRVILMNLTTKQETILKSLYDQLNGGITPADQDLSNFLKSINFDINVDQYSKDVKGFLANSYIYKIEDYKLIFSNQTVAYARNRPSDPTALMCPGPGTPGDLVAAMCSGVCQDQADRVFPNNPTANGNYFSGCFWYCYSPPK